MLSYNLMQLVSRIMEDRCQKTSFMIEMSEIIFRTWLQKKCEIKGISILINMVWNSHVSVLLHLIAKKIQNIQKHSFVYNRNFTIFLRQNLFFSFAMLIIVFFFYVKYSGRYRQNPDNFLCCLDFLQKKMSFQITFKRNGEKVIRISVIRTL